MKMKYLGLLIVVIFLEIRCENDIFYNHENIAANFQEPHDPPLANYSLSDWILNYDDFQINEGTFTGKTALDTIYKDADYSIGRLAIKKDSTISSLKTNKWIKYYRNGTKKEEGEYKINSFLQCCFIGPCQVFYNFKIGFWTYYHKNGKIAAKGKHQIKKYFLDTSCRSGDSIYFGTITDDWKFFSRNGDELIPSDSLIQKYEQVESGQPLGELFTRDLASNTISRK